MKSNEVQPIGRFSAVRILRVLVDGTLPRTVLYPSRKIAAHRVSFSHDACLILNPDPVCLGFPPLSIGCMQAGHATRNFSRSAACEVHSLPLTYVPVPR